MPTAYKGRFRMECRLDRCSKRQIMTNVMPDCIACENATMEILDLDGKVVVTVDMSDPFETEAKEKPATENGEPETKEKRRNKRK